MLRCQSIEIGLATFSDAVPYVPSSSSLMLSPDGRLCLVERHWLELVSMHLQHQPKKPSHPSRKRILRTASMFHRQVCTWAERVQTHCLSNHLMPNLLHKLTPAPYAAVCTASCLLPIKGRRGRDAQAA